MNVPYAISRTTLFTRLFLLFWLAVLAVVLSIAIGKEFLPYLDEGSIWLQVQLPPGLSLPKLRRWPTNFARRLWSSRRSQLSSASSAETMTAPTLGRPPILSVLSGSSRTPLGQTAEITGPHQAVERTICANTGRHCWLLPTHD